jgi:hypothetical protein
MQKVNVLESVWYGEIGIVKIDNGFEIKWYIGRGQGINQERDEQWIAAYGMPFYPQMLEQFFNIKKQENEHS